MLQPAVTFPLPLPDDPRKWDGWSRYNSPNPYERLCLDPRTNPSDEIIEELVKFYIAGNDGDRS